MTLEKLKKSFSNIKNHYAREFLPASKQYFKKEMNRTYSKVVFTKNILNLDLEFKIKLNSLISRFPFIENLIEIRPQFKSYDKFVSISYFIIDDYHKRLKEENTLYITNSTNQKDISFAINVVNDWRRRFYLNIEDIFYFIEKQYSSSLLTNNTSIQVYETEEIKKNKLEDFVVKPLHKIIGGLKEIGFLNKEGKFIYNIKSHNYIHLAILTAKLEVSKCVILESNDYKNVNHQFYKNFFDKGFKYDNSTSIRRRIFDNDEGLGKYQKFYDSLSFLDNL